MNKTEIVITWIFIIVGLATICLWANDNVEFETITQECKDHVGANIMGSECELTEATSETMVYLVLSALSLGLLIVIIFIGVILIATV